MKIRRHESDSKIEIPMASMIDVVFQLLIFFMLTLKIISPEGDFNINMPLGSASAASDEPPPLDIKVRLEANPDGTLKQLYFGGRALGNDAPQCFQRLNNEIAQIAGASRGFSDDLKAEIDGDYNLYTSYTIAALSACRGRMIGDKQVTYIEKIEFAKPRRPE